MATFRAIAVTNTTPIVGLGALGYLSLLADLFETVIVPFEVYSELAAKTDATEPAQLVALPNVRFMPLLGVADEATKGLDSGEQAAISIALGLPGAWVLLDEKDARGVARRLGLPVRGTLGILVESKRRGLLPAIAPLIERLLQTDFRLGDAVVEAALQAAGESTR